MTAGWIAFYILLVASAVAFAIYWCYLVDKNRRESLAAIAGDLKFDFVAKPPKDAIARFENLPMFSKGHAKKISNLMTGSARGVEIAIFDYQYTTGGGQHQHTHRQTILAACSDRLDLPGFELYPENFFHKIAQAVGFKDIDFDDRPVFSKMFVLRGKNETRIREFFNEHLFEFFESHKDVCVNTSLGRAVYCRRDKRVKPEKIEEFLREGFELYALLQANAPATVA